jgi:hypothetical protein
LEAIRGAHKIYVDAGMLQYEASFTKWIKALEAEIAALEER